MIAYFREPLCREYRIQEEQQLVQSLVYACVEEWLNLCRQGKVKTYIRGNDPNLDEAWRQYEEEKEIIRDWAEKSATRKKVVGKTLPLPEVAKHYSQARLREIVSATHPQAAKALFGH
ncbi:hypothetical protein [Coprothermobacter proteolyticus]|uniref:hypothetical protein n=1 Tax=Coprothermobacter proteolyticus TaxID=35786 RepID=UPI001900E2E7|nr:hypothetical protein [Coprothermobacter proteolyticus]